MNYRNIELMNKDKIISDVELVYIKMVNSRLDRKLEMWPLQDYVNFLSMLREKDWNSFGQPMLEKIQGISDRYYGKGEVVSSYCPKIISYDESWSAQKALDSISEYIRSRMNQRNA